MTVPVKVLKKTAPTLWLHEIDDERTAAGAQDAPDLTRTLKASLARQVMRDRPIRHSD
jgi:hypothetical protein